MKKIKIALVKPPATYADWYKRPVIGLSFISASLEKAGVECKIFDALYQSWSEEKLVQQVEAYRPDMVGLTAMTHEITPATRIAKTLKDRSNQITTVVGGAHIAALPKGTLEEFSIFDYGIYGEGEKTIEELIKFLFDRNSELDIHAIDGLVHRNKDQVIVNQQRPGLTSEEMENFPFPAFHQYYGDNTKALAGRDSYYVIYTARGCPYKCSFCMTVLGKQLRGASIERVVEEVEYAISHYGAHTINFSDEIFLFNSKRTKSLLQLMIDRGLHKKIRWSGLTRVNMVVMKGGEELIALAKESGCYNLEMGVESGDNDILKSINKGMTAEDAKEAVKIIKSNNISLGTYYILGQPNETRETAQKTIDLAAELNTNTIAVGIMVPYPGTEIAKMAKRGEAGYRLLTEDWTEYDKYGARSLELKNLSYQELLKFQKKAYFKMYLKNFRLFDMLRFTWERKSALWYFFKKKMRPLLTSDKSISSMASQPVTLATTKHSLADVGPHRFIKSSPTDTGPNRHLQRDGRPA